VTSARCPICATVVSAQREGTPYWTCSGCGAWFQDPMPPKVYAGAHEERGDAMSDADKAANEWLAAYLFDDVLGFKTGRTLDVGAKYPYLASRLQARGCHAVAIDGDPDVERFGAQLGTIGYQLDFETGAIYDDGRLTPWDLITFVHVFEHLYDPTAAMRKLRRLVADDGHVFIRMPDHTVPGIERDLTPGHFSIHPFVHCLASIAELCARTETFRIDWHHALMPGQRDLVLSPI
jgi:SAM-dependent methyltransferase